MKNNSIHSLARPGRILGLSTVLLNLLIGGGGHWYVVGRAEFDDPLGQKCFEVEIPAVAMLLLLLMVLLSFHIHAMGVRNPLWYCEMNKFPQIGGGGGSYRSFGLDRLVEFFSLPFCERFYKSPIRPGKHAAYQSQLQVL